jgi:phosphatidate cytidylyltransferase
MTSFIRALSESQQIGLMVVVIFGGLIATHAVLVCRSARYQSIATSLRADRPLLKRSWIMALVFVLCWILGSAWSTALFLGLSFIALREFITWSPTHRADHRSLILSFFILLPLQYALVWWGLLDVLTVLISVYAFIALPVLGASQGDTVRFLDRNVQLHWGVMVCVFGLSHVPALVILDFEHSSTRSLFLVMFLVLVVQSCMLAQHLAAKRLARHTLPNGLRVFQWRPWLVGMFVGGLVGALMAGMTPFKTGEALAMAWIACVGGTLGHRVIAAIKHDKGIQRWGRLSGTTGATGLLDRIDALYFAAPVFLHALRWYFDV